jgi:hypothetical protein
VWVPLFHTFRTYLYSHIPHDQENVRAHTTATNGKLARGCRLGDEAIGSVIVVAFIDDGLDEYFYAAAWQLLPPSVYLNRDKRSRWRRSDTMAGRNVNGCDKTLAALLKYPKAQ